MARKLVLYSDQEIPENDQVDNRLVELIGKPDATVGYVPSQPDPQRRYFHRKKSYYSRLDLRLTHYFDPETLNYEEDISALFSCDAIHLSGGNTFHFLKWLKALQLIDMLKDYVNAGGVLIGTSAGSILMTPNISTATLCGDTNNVALTDWSSLGLVNFSFWPHFSTANRAFLKSTGVTTELNLYGCPDGSGIIINDGLVELIGDVELVQ
ncbi:MAG: Type 1 glutamine amidotransferase-like domain-containing protein [Cyanobacteria bacterium J06649_4]